MGPLKTNVAQELWVSNKTNRGSGAVKCLPSTLKITHTVSQKSSTVPQHSLLYSTRCTSVVSDVNNTASKILLVAFFHPVKQHGTPTHTPHPRNNMMIFATASSIPLPCTKENGRIILS